MPVELFRCGLCPEILMAGPRFRQHAVERHQGQWRRAFTESELAEYVGTGLAGLVHKVFGLKGKDDE